VADVPVATSRKYDSDVSYFLLVYDRNAGLLLRKERYEIGADAMRARFVAESEFTGRPEVEIVALAAEREDDLLVTHGRYFLGLTALADRIA
jgi:nucleotide-binding universal stress UspA family protein